MKQGLRTLCAIGVLLFAGDACAHFPDVFSSDARSSGMRDIEVIKEYGDAEATVYHLENAKTVKKDKNGNQEKVFGVREEKIDSITVLGSVCPDVKVAKEVFYNNGTSVHFYVQLEKEGNKIVPKIYELVDPKNKAFCDGVSHFGGKSSLNNSTIGIMINTWVFYEKDREDKNIYKKEDLGELVQYPGDSREWVVVSDDLIGAVADLILGLKKEYNIPSKNVNLYSTVTGRRADAPGPDVYNRLAEKGAKEGAKAVFYPTEKEFSLDQFKDLTEKNFLDFLYIYGFNKGKDGKRFENLSNEDLLKMFKLQYSTGDLSGELNDKTKKMILSLIASYYNFEDPITKSVDEVFRKDVEKYLSKNKLTSVEDFVKSWSGK